MKEIPEFVDLEIPICVGDRGSVQAWGNMIKGKNEFVDKGVLSEGITEDEYQRSGVQYGTVKVRVPVREFFSKTVIEGKIES